MCATVHTFRWKSVLSRTLLAHRLRSLPSGETSGRQVRDPNKDADAPGVRRRAAKSVPALSTLGRLPAGRPSLLPGVFHFALRLSGTTLSGGFPGSHTSRASHRLLPEFLAMLKRPAPIARKTIRVGLSRIAVNVIQPQRRNRWGQIGNKKGVPPRPTKTGRGLRLA